MNKAWLYVLVIVGFFVVAGIGFKVVESFSDDEVVEPAIEEVEEVEEVEEAKVEDGDPEVSVEVVEE